MALGTPNSLSAGAGGSAAARTAFNVTPTTTNGRVYLIASWAAAGGAAGFSSITGTNAFNGVTWRQDVLIEDFAGGTATMGIWSCVPASTTTGNVTLTLDASQTLIIMELVEVTDDGSGQTVANSGTGSGSGTAFSADVGSSSASNLMLAAALHSPNTSQTYTAGSGYTLLTQASFSGIVHQQSEYDASAPTDGIADMTASATSANWGMVAVEIQESGGGGGSATAAIANHYRRLRAG